MYVLLINKEMIELDITALQTPNELMHIGKTH